MTALFVVIILLLPFLIDYVAQFVAHLFGAQAVFYFQTRRWLIELAAYVPIYLLMLFYLKTTFNPLATYGYRWSRDYLGWAIYIGLGSGVIMYLVDLVGGLQSLGVPPFSIATAAGYLAGYVLLPALTEETLFRGVMQHFYQGRLTTTISPYHIHVGVFIASAFELAFHLSAPIYYGITTIGVGAAILKTLPQLLYVLVFGAIGGYLYQRTNSLAAPIIIHALGNATEFMLIWATMH
jgi:membrane protease YdiL (CAAX protease family)